MLNKMIFSTLNKNNNRNINTTKKKISKYSININKLTMTNLKKKKNVKPKKDTITQSLNKVLFTSSFWEEHDQYYNIYKSKLSNNLKNRINKLSNPSNNIEIDKKLKTELINQINILFPTKEKSYNLLKKKNHSLAVNNLRTSTLKTPVKKRINYIVKETEDSEILNTSKISFNISSNYKKDCNESLSYTKSRFIKYDKSTTSIKLLTDMYEKGGQLLDNNTKFELYN